MPQTIDNMVATWNNSGTTFTFLKANITDTASAAGSLLMDLQVGGSSKFAFRKDGLLTVNYPTSGTAIRVVGNGQGLIASSTGSDATGFSGYGIRLQSGNSIEWASSTNGPSGGSIILSRKGDANLRLGAADAAAPVAQTLSVQSVVAGTTNMAGANLTITGSQGTGTGAGGSIIFQVAPAGASGTAQNALATALTINPSGTVSIGGMTIDPSNGGVTFLQTFGIMMQTSNAFVIRHGNNDGLDVRPVSSGAPNILLKNASNAIQAALWGEATNTLALRNGANAQAFNVYNTFTDASNYERAVVRWSSNDLQIGIDVAGTGASNRQLHLIGGTSGQIRFYVGTTLGWFVNSSGHFLAGTDNTYDIGASGTTRPRNVYVGNQVVAGGAITGSGSIQMGATGVFSASGRSGLSSPANGIWLMNVNAGGDFDRLQFGGTTSSFPAIKRSNTTLQARLADDSGFASVQGKITTETAYTAGAPTPTGYLVLYDSNGTAYRVPAVLN